VLTKLQDIDNRTNVIVDEWSAKKQGNVDCESVKYSDANIIHQMLDSSELPSNEKTSYRLALEMRTLVGAGTETTGNTLQATTFYLLSLPDKAKRLSDEIREAKNKAAPTQLKAADLQQLPYLVGNKYLKTMPFIANNPKSAVISEGLR
jgi:cytochrome P450